MTVTRSFASDNNAGVHPTIMKALSAVNEGHTVAYGDDVYTESAVKKFQVHFGKNVEVYFVFNGTGANVTGLKTVTGSYEAVICADTAHINTDECGAAEKFIGCKLLTVPAKDGKIMTEQIKGFLHAAGNPHHNQPKVISITQSTELGTVYTPAEIKKLADFAHKNGMFLHMDGARLANAAAHLNVSLKQITGDAGVDILSFGGTKNGMMFGEAVVFFNRELAKNYQYMRKQGMQLASKMRFVAAQFEALLAGDLWLENARHANDMAQFLAAGIEKIPQIKITRQVQANGVFATVPPKYVSLLQKKYFFYVWNPETSEVRWVTSFDTTKKDVQDFVKFIKNTIV